MQASLRAPAVIAALKDAYPEAVCALNYTKPYELLIAARLSAQCTDVRVNQIAPELFSRYPSLEAFANADIAELEQVIHSCGFFRTKARDIVGACQMLLRDYDGQLPDTMDRLLKLPGVGRKTANLLLGDIFGRPAVVCDTHCIRLSNRIGLAQGQNPEKVEQQLRDILPPDESSDFCHRLVLHGRAVCTARKPDCARCTLAQYCKTASGE